MGSMSSLRWTQSCQLLENPLSSGTLSNLSVGTKPSDWSRMSDSDKKHWEKRHKGGLVRD